MHICNYNSCKNKIKEYPINRNEFVFHQWKTVNLTTMTECCNVDENIFSLLKYFSSKKKKNEKKLKLYRVS